MGRIVAFVGAATVNGLIGCTGVPKAGDDEGIEEDGSGAMPLPVNRAPVSSFCCRLLVGLSCIAVITLLCDYLRSLQPQLQ